MNDFKGDLAGADIEVPEKKTMTRPQVRNPYGRARASLVAMIFLGSFLCLGNGMVKCDDYQDAQTAKINAADKEIAEKYGDGRGDVQAEKLIKSIKNMAYLNIVQHRNELSIWYILVALIQCIAVYAGCKVGLAIIDIAENGRIQPASPPVIFTLIAELVSRNDPPIAICPILPLAPVVGVTVSPHRCW